MTFEELLLLFDFDYKEYPDGYGFIDLQGANLGDIESERYSNPIDMVKRLYDGIYGNDYFFNDEELEEHGYDTAEELIAAVKDNKEIDPFLYYCINPEQLTDLPPVLKTEDVEDRLFDIGCELASVYGGECYNVHINMQDKSVTFDCIEHGEKFCCKLTYADILKDYNLDLKGEK